jgi:hypothetical protein
MAEAQLQKHTGQNRYGSQPDAYVQYRNNTAVEENIPSAPI